MSYSDQTFTFEINDENEIAGTVSQLNLIFDGFANFEIAKINDRTTFLVIKIDKDIDMKKSRNAGRKVQHPQTLYTHKQVKEMMKELSNDEVAKKLGYSRATFYRRLNKLKNATNLSDNDDHYFI